MAFIGAKPTNVPLTSADIQDGTVGLADLSASGTKSSSTFLRGDNTFAEAGGGSLNLISAQTASSASTLTFTSSHITSTYKVYQLHCIDVVQSSDGGNLGFEVSPNNGSSYVQSGYLNIRFISNQTNGANSILSSAGTGDTNVKICGAGEGIGANGNESAQSIITLFNPLGAKAKLFKSDGVQLNSSGQLNMQRHLYGLDQSATYLPYITISSLSVSMDALNSLLKVRIEFYYNELQIPEIFELEVI